MSSRFKSLETGKKLDFRKQSFSSIDLDKTETEPGIVYPIQKADSDGNQACFAYLVEHIANSTILAHSEYRLANNTNEGVNYTKGSSVSIVYNPLNEIIQTTLAEKAIGISNEVVAINDSYAVIEDSLNISNDTFMKEYRSILKSLDFTPAFVIDSSNLNQKDLFYKPASYAEILFDDIKELRDRVLYMYNISNTPIPEDIENLLDKDISKYSVEELEKYELVLSNILGEVSIKQVKHIEEI